MSNLQFTYASTRNQMLPTDVAEDLRRHHWTVRPVNWDAVSKLSSLPDFTWLDFGEAPARNIWEDLLRRLAKLQSRTDQHVMLFFSGSVLNPRLHSALVDFIYAIFPDPSDVVTDLAGQPDIRAAVAKLLALRRTAPTRKAALQRWSRATKPVLAVPNSDLRSERGNLSIKRIADLFGVSVIEVGRIIGREKRASLSKTPDADSLQEPLQSFSDIASLRLVAPGDDEFRKWLRTPNENMKGRTPIDWIREGRVRDVAGFVFSAISGQAT